MYPNSIKCAREDAPVHGSGYQWSRRLFKGKAETHRSGSQQAFSRTRLLICRQSIAVLMKEHVVLTFRGLSEVNVHHFRSAVQHSP